MQEDEVECALREVRHALHTFDNAESFGGCPRPCAPFGDRIPVDLVAASDDDARWSLNSWIGSLMGSMSEGLALRFEHPSPVPH